ncbi:MAG TPA: MGMT family protein [Candidatus Saccharimonadales bacterium]|jgi:methylated-DNA-protein-cysteine methyltransferase-like protein|nr:MGMT family protein [Candidatus Saccharimonadales bacterium]
MSRVDAEFAKRVYELVAQIPKGRVMTYGQIAALCGAAWAAWEVGQIAHTGPVDLPWQRVVNKKGGLAAGWPGGGRETHASILRADGVEVSDDFTVDVGKLLWDPSQTTLL